MGDCSWRQSATAVITHNTAARAIDQLIPRDCGPQLSQKLGTRDCGRSLCASRDCGLAERLFALAFRSLQ